MANAIISQNDSQTRSMEFTAAPNLYQFCQGVTALEIEDQINARQTQLEAMLRVGAEVDSEIGGDSFSDYFWACRAVAEEIGQLTRELIARTKKH